MEGIYLRDPDGNLVELWRCPSFCKAPSDRFSVRDYNHFSQNYYNSLINSLQLHQFTCTCGHSACLKIHGYYKRGVLLPDGIFLLAVCRVKCSKCGKTHAILPSSLVLYDRISLMDQHHIICDYENGSDRYAVCGEPPSVDENLVTAVIRRYLLA